MLREFIDELTKVLDDNAYLREELAWSEESNARWGKDYDLLQEENEELREENAELTKVRQSYEALKAGDLERQITRLEVENAELREAQQQTAIGPFKNYPSGPRTGITWNS